MRLNIKRNTGFFGMGSPLEIIENGETIAQIGNNEEKEIEVAEEKTIQAKMSFLKSEPYHVVADKEAKNIEIKMNPSIFKLYVTFFTFIFIFPLLFRSWVLGIFILLAYVVFVFIMSKKFYTIEEEE